MYMLVFGHTIFGLQAVENSMFRYLVYINA